ncbi:hypothetical protein IGI67_005169 [Enterococcus sp. AZ196]
MYNFQQLATIYILFLLLSIQIYRSRDMILNYKSSKKVLLIIVTINIVLLIGATVLCKLIN